VLRLSGKGALSIARAFLRLGDAPVPRRAALVWAVDAGERLDRTLATWFPAGRSYTGEETVEVSAHGSPYILERLLELAREAGARDALPGEFSQRAFLNGRLDLAQAEAVCELIASETKLEHRAALSRLEGGLSRRVAGLRSRLLEISALIEANLDHPDEDLPPLELEAAAARLEALAGEIGALEGGQRRGRLGGAHPRVVVAGRPNAGKSLLLNALLGADRAIVSEVAGTTRDTIEESADLRGLRAVLVDTAGLGDPGAGGPLEAEGQRRTRTAIQSADLTLIVLDRSLPPESHRAVMGEIRELCGEDAAIQPVLSKCDLPPGTRASDIDGPAALETSALRGLGIEALAGAVRQRLSQERSPFSGLEVGARHRAALAVCREEAEFARDALAQGDEDAEILAGHHLRRASDALDAVTGRTTSEDVLREIFSRFCVGK